MAHSLSASAQERMGDYVPPRERDLRDQEAVHGGGVHGSGVWTDERTLNDWHLQNSVKYAGPFHPEYVQTPPPTRPATPRHAGRYPR